MRTFNGVSDLGCQTATDWYNTGLSLAVRECHWTALIYCDQALELDPKLAGAWHSKGLRSHIRIGPPQRARGAICEQ
jgi:hypothetical protein